MPLHNFFRCRQADNTFGRLNSAPFSFLKGALIIALLGMAGCESTGPLYYWGEYPKMLELYYSQPGNMTAAQQVRLLQNTIENAERAGRKVAPGIYAHLGVAYADLGKQTEAEAAFSAEVELYPESKIWLEGMVARARKAVETEQ